MSRVLTAFQKISMILTMTAGVKHFYPQPRASRKKLSPSNPQTNSEQYRFTSAPTLFIAYLASPISTAHLSSDKHTRHRKRRTSEGHLFGMYPSLTSRSHIHTLQMAMGIKFRYTCAHRRAHVHKKSAALCS